MAPYSFPRSTASSKRGFGLVQVLVAISLASLLMIALSSIMNQMSSSGAAVREKMEFLETAAEVRALLDDSSACTDVTFQDANGNPASQASDIKRVYSARFQQVVVPNSFVTDVVVEGITGGFRILLKAKKPLSGPQPRDYEFPKVPVVQVNGKYKCDFFSGGGSGPDTLVKDFRNETICANGVPDPSKPDRSSQVVWRLRGVKQDGSVEYNAFLGGENSTRSAILRVDADGVIVPNSFDSNQPDILQPLAGCQFKIQ